MPGRPPPVGLPQAWASASPAPVRRRLSMRTRRSGIRRRAGYRPLGPSGASRPRASMQCPPRHRLTHIQPASGSICRSVGTTGLRTAAVIVVFACPAGAEKVRVTADGGEVARLVRGRVPAELALADLPRAFRTADLWLIHA